MWKKLPKLKYNGQRTMIENFLDEHDHETPHCPICQERVGLHNDALLMLHGQFFMNKGEGYAMFILDPDTKIGFIEIPDGLGPGQPQYAIIIDPNPEGPVAAAHSECVEDELSLAADPDDDGDDEHEEDLDAAMERALENDHTHWDENDILNRRRG